MDESFYSTELSQQFELVDAEYAYSNAAHQEDAYFSDEEDAEVLDSSVETHSVILEAEGNISIREEDEVDMKAINNFMAVGCSCSLGPTKSPCSKLIRRETVSATRLNCLEMTNSDLDMVVLSHLDAHRRIEEITDTTGDSTITGVQQKHRIAVDYFFQGKRVCKSTYLFVHAIGPKRYKNLVRHYEKHGLVPRMHGNVKRLPPNTVLLDRTKLIVRFISNFATVHALPLPGRLPGQFSDEKALLLPSHMSKRYVYRQYKQVCEESNDLPVSRRKFEDIWNGLLPHISSMKPKTDLCHVCQENVMKIVRSINLPESEKTDSLKEAEMHLKLAKQEREVYNTQCMKCVEELKTNPQSPKVVHVSFDFAQQIHFPSSPQQVGPLYFLTPRKCQLFGVCSESHMEQVNYLIDENDFPGKGANAVVSMVHHYLDFKLATCPHLLLHADNAVGQNKNNTLLGYLAWRVSTGRNRSLEMSFMLPGHTKFAPDRFFGQIKKLYRRTSVSTLCEIEEIVRNSIIDGRNIPLTTVNCRAGSEASNPATHSHFVVCLSVRPSVRL